LTSANTLAHFHRRVKDDENDFLYRRHLVEKFFHRQGSGHHAVAWVHVAPCIWDQCYKTFYVYFFLQMFVKRTCKTFQPSLIFARKARAYPSESPSRCSTLGYAPGKHYTILDRLSSLLFDLSKPFKPCLIFARKARAYPSEIPFRCSTPGYAPRHTHKHYTILERLSSLLFALSKPFQPSIIFAGEARACQSESRFRCSTLGSALPNNNRLSWKYTFQISLLFALSKPSHPSLIFAGKAL